jgi:hypothetical protein
MNDLLEGTLRIVSLRFRVNNLKLVPQGIREKVHNETPSQFIARQSSRAAGEECIAPTKDVSCAQFLNDLTATGYVMIDAFFQVLNPKYIIVRFDFVILEHFLPSDEFSQGAKIKAEIGLRNLAEKNMWRIQAYLNPFFFEGYEIDDQYGLAINLDSRKPLVDKNGQTILVWEKDEQRERVGEAPIELRPKLFLQIQDDEIVICE